MTASVAKKNQFSDLYVRKKKSIKYNVDLKTVNNNCAVALHNIEHFDSVQSHKRKKDEEFIKSDQTHNIAEFIVETSNEEEDMFEIEEADILLPPLYLLKGEGMDKWVLLSDLCNLLKVKSKDTILNKVRKNDTFIANLLTYYFI